jgi:hypothetical protein
MVKTRPQTLSTVWDSAPISCLGQVAGAWRAVVVMIGVVVRWWRSLVKCRLDGQRL